MFTEFKYTLRRLRGQIIGWGVGLFLYGLMMAMFYNTVQNMDQFMELIQQYPKELMAFVGDMTAITSPPGYMHVYYFSYMSIIVGVFAAGAGAGLLVGDEEKGILDLLMSYPLSRTRFYWGRFLGYASATALILVIGWLGWVIPSGSSGMELSALEFLRPYLPLFAILMFFGSLATLLSMLLPSSRMAGMFSGALVVANFLVLGLANLNENIEPIIKYTPLYYYQGGEAVSELNIAWFIGLLGISIIFALLAWWRFQQRDIRVGGERGWSLPRLAGLLNRG